MSQRLRLNVWHTVTVVAITIHLSVVGVIIAEIDVMTETKVYKLRDAKQVDTFTTLLGVEGIKYHVFRYEEYTAIEVTAGLMETIRVSAIYHIINLKI